jgi:hypothetical protein
VTLAARRLLQALALGLAIATAYAGLHDVSRAWDVWYYHLPFAARLVGLVGPDAYGFHATNQSRLDGFPLLVELLQGLAWRVTRRPEGANLVAMASLAIYVAFLRRAFQVPIHLAFLALMAIPLVQIHVTSSYVDLPSNLCAAALVLLVVRLYATPDEARARRDGLAIMGLAALTANMRFQLHPLVALAALAAVPRIVPPLWRARDARWLALLGLFIPLVGATFLKNALVHQNPYYPMRIALGGHVLPGPDTPYSSSPVFLEHAPRALRFAYSVLEIGIPPLSDGRCWTVDQWAPWDSPALRMGGFFGAYVVFNLALLAWTVARRRVGDRARRARVAGVAFAAFTLVMANVPQSHELRYYLCWMLVLVSTNLWLVGDREPASEPARGRSWEPADWLSLACTAFLAVVLGVTRCCYVWPSGVTFDEHLRDAVDPTVLARIHDGDRVCLRREPNTFLYAATFHGRRYFVQEAETEADCGDARWLP